MSDSTVFNNLVAQLNENEKQELLDKIRRSYNQVAEPFIDEEQEKKVVDVQAEYEQFGLIAKFVIFFKSLFSQRERTEVIEEHLLKKHVLGIQREHPNLLDTTENLALSGLYKEIQALSNISSLFLTPLQTVLEGAKQEFVTYLAGFEMEIIQQQLEEAVNPFSYESHFEVMGNEEIKKELQFKLEDILLDITEDQRVMIGEQLSDLQNLLELCKFPFEDILKNFSPRESDGEMVCRLSLLKEHFLTLENILFSLREPPEAVTIQALFLYLYRKEVTHNDNDLEDKINKQLERTSLTMQNIRHFHKAVPLVNILKYILNNINYYPEAELKRSDWFTLFKGYWYDVLDRHFKDFIAERRKKQAIIEANEFLQEPVFPLLHYYRDRNISLLFKPRFPYTIAFLHHYVKKYLGQIFKRELQTILIDGEFYKEKNRQDFTDAYNTLFQLEGKVRFLEDSLSSEGGIGQKIADTDKELISKPLKKKKIENLTEGLEKENSQMVRASLNGIIELHNVINGIMYGEIGGRYDTLSNLSYLGGNDNKGFKKRLDGLIANLREAQDHLQELTSIEK